MSEDQHGIATDPRDWPKTLFYVALLFSVFQIVTAAFSPVSSIVLRAVHVGFLLWVVFLSYPAYGKQRPWQPLAWVLSLGSVATALYQWVFEADLIQRSGDLTTADMIIGVILIVLVFEAARRVMGIALPIICGLFLAYGLFGEYLPGDLAHRGYGVDQIINQLSFGTEGLYGTPTYVSATYIFLFILFGAFLEKGRHDQAVHRFRHGPVRPQTGRAGESGGGVIGADGHHHRLRHRQRGYHRAIHHPVDEALRLQGRVCRRCGSDFQHGQPDHAAGNGRGGLHHGRNHQCAVR
nr:hypothetical protein GCM10020185_65550 [Pseudomonas brassicacearum subsp. brassicacearum]